MQYGFYTPNFDFCGDARVLADLAADAERAGWEGFFIWDHLQFDEPTVDPWIALTAMALRTRRIRLGTLVTPVPRRHLAKLAREVISLDHLSQGRVILGVGAGFAALPDYAAFGDGTDPKVRAAQLDEALPLLSALLNGQPVQHRGTHYRIECAAFQPTVQQPRVPIWVAASWSAKKTLDRAARWDGVAPVGTQGLDVRTDDLRGIASYTAAARGSSAAPFDVICFGRTQNSRDTASVSAGQAAGATWWMESVFTRGSSLTATRDRIREGPPRI